MGFLDKLFDQKKPLLTLTELGERLASEIARLPKITEARFDEGNHSVNWHAENDASGKQFLEKMYAQYQENPTDLELILHAHRLIVKEAAEQEHLNRTLQENVARQHNIFPVIKPVEWLNQTRQQLKKFAETEDLPFVYQQLNQALLLVYIKDFDDKMSFISDEDAKSLGGLDDLHHLAIQNFKVQKLPQVQLQGGSGRYGVRLDGYYDASVVLFLDQLQSKFDLKGDVVCAIPARNELLICGSEDQDNVSSLREIAEYISTDTAYPISNLLFVKRVQNEFITLI